MAEHPLPTPEELREHAAEMRGVVKGFVDFNQSEQTPEQWRGKGIVLVGEMHLHVKSIITAMYAAEGCAASGSKAKFDYTMEADKESLARINPQREKRFQDYIVQHPDLQTSTDSLKVPAKRVAVLATTIGSPNPLGVFEHGFLSTLGEVKDADPLWRKIEDFGGAETFSDEHEDAMVGALAEKAQNGIVFASVGALHLPILVEKLHAMGIPLKAINAAGRLPQTTDVNYKEMIDVDAHVRLEKLKGMQKFGLVYTPQFGANEQWSPDTIEPDAIASFKRALEAIAEDPDKQKFYLKKLDKHVPSPPLPQTAPQIEPEGQKKTPDGAGIMNLVPPDVVTNFQQLNTDHAMANIPHKTAPLGVQKSASIA